MFILNKGDGEMGAIIGVYEIAGKASVTTGAVTNWIRRYSDFPAPVTEVQGRSGQNHYYSWNSYNSCRRIRKKGISS